MCVCVCIGAVRVSFVEGGIYIGLTLTRINVFLWRSHRHANRVWCLVHPVFDMNTYICKVNVFTKQAKSE